MSLAARHVRTALAGYHPGGEPEPVGYVSLVNGIGTGVTWEGGGSTHTFNPATALGTSVGDLAVIYWSRVNLTSTVFLTAPSGWTEGPQANYWGATHAQLFYRLLDGSSDDVAVFTFPHGAAYSRWFGAFTNVDPLFPVADTFITASPDTAPAPAYVARGGSAVFTAFDTYSNDNVSPGVSGTTTELWHANPRQWECSAATYLATDVDPTSAYPLGVDAWSSTWQSWIGLVIQPPTDPAPSAYERVIFA